MCVDSIFKNAVLKFSFDFQRAVATTKRARGLAEASDRLRHAVPEAQVGIGDEAAHEERDRGLRASAGEREAEDRDLCLFVGWTSSLKNDFQAGRAEEAPRGPWRFRQSGGVG